MTVTGVADCAILVILRSSSISRKNPGRSQSQTGLAIGKRPNISQIGLQLRRLGFQALPPLRVSLPAPQPAPWASLAPSEARCCVCCCGVAGVVSGLFGRLSLGTSRAISCTHHNSMRTILNLTPLARVYRTQKCAHSDANIIYI
jgi:hypothetical protein